MGTAFQTFSEPLDDTPIPSGYDPELLYVECARCGSPVMWEQGRASRLLKQAGIDPLELDASCQLMTDGCPRCSQRKQYSVQIVRLSSTPNVRRPPSMGNA
ncbi:MAG: hypothetical protein IJU37_09265 [Desulfovibrio sp.]|nr:hypothetical protein [Desulfovibrio sp.]